MPSVRTRKVLEVHERVSRNRILDLSKGGGGGGMMEEQIHTHLKAAA